MWSGLALAAVPVTLVISLGAWPNLLYALIYLVPIGANAVAALRWPRASAWLFITGGVLTAIVLLPFLAMGLYSVQPGGVEAGEWLSLAIGLVPSALMVIGGVLMLSGVRR